MYYEEEFSLNQRAPLLSIVKRLTWRWARYKVSYVTVSWKRVMPRAYLTSLHTAGLTDTKKILPSNNNWLDPSDSCNLSFSFLSNFSVKPGVHTSFEIVVCYVQFASSYSYCSVQMSARRPIGGIILFPEYVRMHMTKQTHTRQSVLCPGRVHFLGPGAVESAVLQHGMVTSTSMGVQRGNEV